MEDDVKEEELETLSSIYPELVRDKLVPYRFELSIPVSPSDPVELRFEPGVGGSPTVVRHLPPVNIVASLPAGYPAEAAPDVRLSTLPAWIPPAKLKELENESAKLWEEYGGCQILFAYIDLIQQAAERGFDLSGKLQLPETLRSDIIVFDRARQREIFETSSYECGVCLEPKKGSLCYRLQSCGHVFCRSCLQDFFNSAITEGDIVNITCLEPSCGKSKDGGRDHKKRSLHPRELLEIGISEAQARRFVELKRKKQLESDKSTIYCPRTWCQAPARSSKYPPIPTNLHDYVDSDDPCDDSADPPPVYTKDTPDKKLPTPSDRLTICSKCSLAFCRVCYAGWHGEFARCWPRNPSELSEEEKASYDYIRLHTSPCPTCSSPTQKTMGCNHMNCFQCNTHFCYLCGAWLVPDNPYQHFNDKSSNCYMRLWELEGGDEGDGNGAFDGPRRWEAEARAIAAAAEEDEAIAAAAADGVDGEQDRAGARVEQVEAHPVLPRPAAVDLVRMYQRARPNPPPGPIDPMHALALRRENMPAPDHGGHGPADQGAPLGGRRRVRFRPRPAAVQRRNNPGGNANGNARLPAVPRHAEDGQGLLNARQEAAIRRFVAMAARDEEDEWDSDEFDEDDFEIGNR